MKPFRLIAAALGTALVTSAAQAEVQKFMNTCDGRLCPYYQIVLTPPEGWTVDQAATKKNRVQIMVPKGKTYANAPALIYVQVFYHRDKQQTLENFAEASNGRWQGHVKDAKVSALPAVARANGKPGFLRFAFENPSKKQQPYEFGAFGVDTDADGNEFVLDVVMTGGDKAALDRAEKDYIAFLKAH
jgi:hypothetical protein